jgi:hypothetical protein
MAEKARLYQVRLNAGGYESGKYGKYYGHGNKLYRLITEDDQIEFRAVNRENAKDVAAVKIPGIKFYR